MLRRFFIQRTRLCTPRFWPATSYVELPVSMPDINNVKGVKFFYTLVTV